MVNKIDEFNAESVIHQLRFIVPVQCNDVQDVSVFGYRDFHQEASIKYKQVKGLAEIWNIDGKLLVKRAGLPELSYQLLHDYMSKMLGSAAKNTKDKNIEFNGDLLQNITDAFNMLQETDTRRLYATVKASRDLDKLQGFKPKQDIMSNYPIYLVGWWNDIPIYVLETKNEDDNYFIAVDDDIYAINYDANSLVINETSDDESFHYDMVFNATILPAETGAHKHYILINQN